MKKIVCFILMILLFTPASASAEEPLTLHLETYQTETNSISLYFNTNLKQDLTSSQLSLSLGDQELPLTDIKTIEEEKLGITYLFLVDISGSMKDKKQSYMKEILSGIANQVEEKDNAAIMLVGDDFTINNFVQGKEKLLDQVEAIERSSQDTNLYAAIIEALGILNTSNSVQTKKCLIVLSDGMDDYTTGYTREEVNLKIEESHLPIYTVALLNKDASSDLVEAAKILGSFARLSSGGVDITFGLDEITSLEVSDSIVQSVEQGYILTADTSSVNITGDQSYLELKLNVEGQGSVADGYMITSSTIQIQGTPTPKVEETPSLAPTEAAPVSEPEVTDTDQENPQNRMLILVIGLPVLILLLVLTMIIIKKRKKGGTVKEMNESGSEINDAFDTLHTVSQIPQRPTDKLELHFTKVGLSEGEMFTVMIDTELIIGRDSSKAQFIFVKDDLLSSKHCKITYKNKNLYLEDLNSTNGTFLNGVPVKQAHLLEQDDIILIGSMELRISWKIK